MALEWRQLRRREDSKKKEEKKTKEDWTTDLGLHVPVYFSLQSHNQRYRQPWSSLAIPTIHSWQLLLHERRSGAVEAKTPCLFQAISAQQRRGSGPITSPHLEPPLPWLARAPLGFVSIVGVTYFDPL